MFFFFNDTATTEIYTLSLHDALPILLLASLLIWRPAFMLVLTVAVLIAVVEPSRALEDGGHRPALPPLVIGSLARPALRSEEHTSGLQSRQYLVCRLLAEKKKK